MPTEKSVHCIVLDASPLLLNQPSISSLLATAEEIYTVPAVIAEIRDPTARSRLETTVLPFLTVRNPSPGSVRSVSEFARKTGDFAVLSGPDLQLLALAYELECERNNGDWRLRKAPGQKTLNGAPPSTISATDDAEAEESAVVKPDDSKSHVVDSPPELTKQSTLTATEVTAPASKDSARPNSAVSEEGSPEKVTQGLAALQVEDGHVADAVIFTEVPESITDAEETEEIQPESDGEGWITPSNLKRHQKKDQEADSRASKQPSKLQVATLTTDYALQNTLLLMNLNLLSSSLSRISHLKSHILRCHACFATSKQMDRQFCQRCGKPTLTRVTCTTSASGEFRLHLKKNMQWNHRGDRYSIPKPTHGSSSGKLGKGGRGQGGKGGWGKELLLTEDQKEYTRALAAQKRSQVKDLMDEDYLPNILSGARSSTSKVKIGPGRDVNARKR